MSPVQESAPRRLPAPEEVGVEKMMADQPAENPPLTADPTETPKLPIDRAAELLAEQIVEHRGPFRHQPPEAPGERISKADGEMI